MASPLGESGGLRVKRHGILKLIGLARARSTRADLEIYNGEGQLFPSSPFLHSRPLSCPPIFETIFDSPIFVNGVHENPDDPFTVFLSISIKIKKNFPTTYLPSFVRQNTVFIHLSP